MFTLTESKTVRNGETYKLTDDLYWPRQNGAAIIAHGGATIDLNGHRIIGMGGADNISSGVFAFNQSNITVKNGTISGFNIGVNVVDTVARDTTSYSQTDNKIIGMTIQNCSTSGFVLGGNYCLVERTTITNIGLDGVDLSRAFGGEFFGPNATFSNSRVSKLNGGSESIGVSFSSRGQVNGTVVDSVLDGKSATGQSFGIWGSDIKRFVIRNSDINNWDYPIGNLAGVSYASTDFVSNGGTPGFAQGIDLDGLSTFRPHFQHTAGDDAILGDKAGQRFMGGEGKDFIAGMGGHDHLSGGGGADVFAYITPPSVFDKDVIMDFHNLHGDKFGFAREIYGAAADANGQARLQHGENATGNQATFLQYDLAYTLYFDPDGAGSAPKIPIAYIPYMILKPGDLTFLVSPADPETLRKFAPSWGAQAVGDFNRDGNADLLWQYSAGNLSEWLMFDGLRPAPFGLPAMPGSRVIAAADLNGDGTTDLLWRSSTDVVTSWFMKEGRFVTNLQYGNFKGWELVASGDFNGDGTDDLMWQNTAGRLSEWLMFNGVNNASNNTLPNMLGSKAKAGDFDGDGTTDLMWQQANGTNLVWIMDNGQRATTVFLPTVREWTNIAVGDFNDDGTDDLLWRHDTSGALIAWDMQNGRQTGTRYLGQSAGLEFLGAGDVNGDGTDDLFWRTVATTDVKVWIL